MIEEKELRKMCEENFIKFDDGEPKVLKLSKWRSQTKFKNNDGTAKDGVEFQVLEEDSQTYGNDSLKFWNITAKNALKQLMPIILEAQKKGDNTIDIRVIRTGEGKNTTYSIKDLK